MPSERVRLRDTRSSSRKASRCVKDKRPFGSNCTQPFNLNIPVSRCPTHMKKQPWLMKRAQGILASSGKPVSRSSR